MKNNHPYLLPIGEENNRIKNNKFQVRLKRLQRLLQNPIKQRHIVISHIRRYRQDPINNRICLLIKHIIPIGWHPWTDLVIRINQNKNSSSHDLHYHVLKNSPNTSITKKFSLHPVRKLIRFLKIRKRISMRHFRTRIFHDLIYPSFIKFVLYYFSRTFSWS